MDKAASTSNYLKNKKKIILKKEKFLKTSSNESTDESTTTEVSISDDDSHTFSDTNIHITPNLSKPQGFVRNLPFRPNARLDPRVAAAYIGLSTNSLFDILGPIYSHHIENMSDGTLTTGEAIEMTDPKDIFDIKRNIMESVIEFGRKSYLREQFMVFNQRKNICTDAMHTLFEEERFNVYKKVDDGNYLSHKAIEQLTGNPFLPRIMKLKDQEKFRSYYLVDRFFDQNAYRCSNKKRKLR
jgi:hypothetical protein